MVRKENINKMLSPYYYKRITYRCPSHSWYITGVLKPSIKLRKSIQWK